jgi:hypothetical protein
MTSAAALNLADPNHVRYVLDRVDAVFSMIPDLNPGQVASGLLDLARLIKANGKPSPAAEPQPTLEDLIKGPRRESPVGSQPVSEVGSAVSAETDRLGQDFGAAFRVMAEKNSHAFRKRTADNGTVEIALTGKPFVRAIGPTADEAWRNMEQTMLDRFRPTSYANFQAMYATMVEFCL